MIYEYDTSGSHTDLNFIWCYEDNAIEPGTVYGPVIRDYYILEFCTHGCEETVVNGQKFVLNAGEGMFLFPGDIHIHSTIGDTPRYGYYFAISGTRVRMLLKALGITGESPYISDKAAPEVLYIMKKIYNMQSEAHAGSQLKSIAYVYELFGELMKHSDADGGGERYIEKAARIIETRYFEPLTVDGIARELALNRVYFSRLFHSTMGMTTQEYLIKIRLEKACSLLELSRGKISEISAAVGIKPESFSRLFKQKLGISPTEYRASVCKNR